jgi:hypothetical protein
MDDDLRQWLFDPAGTRCLVLAHRPAGCSVVTAVVSDVVWQEVVRLLRWAVAGPDSAPALDAGRWWRLAAECAELLRRMPALCDELGEPWSADGAVEEPEVTGSARVELEAGRLAALLRSPATSTLRQVATEVDALGAAAIRALAEGSSWQVPGRAL